LGGAWVPSAAAESLASRAASRARPGKAPRGAPEAVSRDFTMLNDINMTLVNGFNTNGAANEFSYSGTISYNGEDFIEHDGGFTIGALMYEDYLASLE